MTLQAQFTIRRGNFSLDVDFSTPAQGITALLGPSGCGKTTVLRAIAGLDHYPGGRLLLGNQLWQTDAMFVPTYKRGIAYVFQEDNLFSHLSVLKNLHYGYNRIPKNQRLIQFDDIVSLLNINRLLSHKVTMLSGGERQRIAIARALLTSPKLILMDEPLAALDEQSKQEVYPLFDLLTTQFNIPIVYVSHSTDEVARLADYIVVIQNDQVQLSGAINSMLTDPDSPLSHGPNAESVFDLPIMAHDTQYGLSLLKLSSKNLYVPILTKEIGQSVRIRILARDVSITLTPQTDTSILNILPARIESIQDESKSQCLVHCKLENYPVLALVTHKSVDHLQLHPDKSVYIQIKSVAVLS